MDYNLEVLEKGCEDLGIYLDDAQKIQFIKYYEVLVEWNKLMNLTAITDLEEVLLKHFVDSLAVVKAVDLQKVESVIDIGTGAGFPGIPIKIAYPELSICLLDSLKKRVKFLDEVIAYLGLKHTIAIHGRAEDFAKNKMYREAYDLCTSRAVANLSTLCEYCLPYVNLGGVFVSYKSGKAEEELKTSEKAIKTLGGFVKDVIKFHLPGSDIERSLIVIEKRERTPLKYPRKAGLPAKEPLS